ncbi:MAG: hypothetical protein CO108_17900 [Deltaproteobacteria bacterium CG_4_9_14_3_um_filter_63_12]|nr:MAG: hypothetical protein CO108_17900 [Deltaproteobacteria bacterium CG_4_9_14_3_um_filter_63_12]
MSKLTLFLLALLVALTPTGCGAARSAMVPELAPLNLGQPVEANYFTRDKTGGIAEGDLITLLNSPVFLEEDTRIGVVPVAVAYEMDEDLPLTEVPRTLSEALEETGFFDVASELSTDWPTDASVAGLRELAGRYRTRYLLLYRHRFADEEYTNPWGWTYLTVVAIPFVPATTMSTAGVLEASLFDAQTGTVLFTVFERVTGEGDYNIWHNEQKLRELKGDLLTKAAKNLSKQVVGKVHRLVAARPDERSNVREASVRQAPSEVVAAQ